MAMYANLLVVIPAYNESKVIKEVIQSLLDKGFTNICLINDGSTDLTSEIAKSTGIHVIDHIVNIGVGGATTTGFNYAIRKGFDFVVTVDGDGQHSVDDVIKISNELLEGRHDLIVGSRLESMKRVNPIRYFFNHTADFIVSAFTFRYTRDTQSGLRGYKRELLKQFNLRSSGYEICSEIITTAAKLTKNIKNIPIKAIYTDYSKQKGQKLSNSINLISKLFLLHTSK